MMPGDWCGICNIYGDHDTAHHAAGGELAAGDNCLVDFEGREYRAVVEEIRGSRMRVAFSLSRGRTHNLWVDRDAAKRVT